MQEKDLQKYLQIISEFKMTDEAKVELIASVLLIAQNFVDRAYGQDAVQLSVENQNKTQTNTGADSMADIYS